MDLFSVNALDNVSGMRAGVLNPNSQQSGTIAAVLKNTIRREETPRQTPTPLGTSPSPQPSPITDTPAANIADDLTALTTNTPITNRAEIANLVAGQTALSASVQKTQREAIARALGEVVQTRTWNLMIDVIAQSGRYAPTATTLTDFVVEGEKRYWLHIAIDRFTGQVVDRQLEAVYE
jgi:hypothetical protein